jgi:LuxR family maltose regulon positive regulatory protein
MPQPASDSPSAAFSTVLPILATKLYVSRARPNLVTRPRLLARLSASMIGKLTLIAAPAGFGKTALVAEWLTSLRQESGDSILEDALQALNTQSSASRVAWLSLDAGDNDPIRFWSYIVAALDLIAPGVQANALALLQASQQLPVDAVLMTVLNALSARAAGRSMTSPDVLVLDDYHVIAAPAIHQALATLIDYLPPHLHVVIASRADPPLPLARWRARGALAELRAPDLRFTPEEAATFLTDVMQLPLAAAEVAALETHTEGWIAGLHLAALAMRDRSDLAGFVATFTGNNRYIVDYLVQEVLESLPTHLRTFVLQTSILDRLCGPLCDAVM